MKDRLGRAWVLGVAACLVLAFGVAGCGGSSAPEATGGEATTSEPEAGAGGESGGEGELLAGLEPPADAKLLDEKSSGNVVYQHYSTSYTPQQVEVLYGEEVEAAGWSIVESGGSGGGWGPYGGSDYGLTAKREDEYFDVQAGGEKGSTSYFEICATSGEGTREACDRLANESDTSSGGSQSGSDSESSSSGGS